MKKYIKYIVIILIIAVAIMLWGKHRKAQKAPEWRTDKATEGSIREVVTSTGSINPYVMVNVGTEVSGKIEKIYKDFNDFVKKGDLLAKLDTELLKTAVDLSKGDLAKATTAMEEAKLDYELLKELYKKDMTPEYDMKKAEFKYESAKQSVANAKLNLQRAQKNLDNAFISSPIDGIIVSRDVDEGQTVAASLNSPTLFVIANNLDQMQITASVDEADIGKIRMNMPVEFSVDAHPTSNFDGFVKQIRLNPTSESNVVSYSVIIDAKNPERKLLPGMTTNVTFVVQAKESVLRIPETATRFRPSKEVWELFGLEWDDEILNASKKAMMAAMEKSRQDKSSEAPKAGKTVADNSIAKSKLGGAIPDSIKAKIAKMSDSERKAFIAKRREGNSGTINSGGSFTGAGAPRTRIRPAVVWILEGKTPKPVAIKTGISDGAFVEVVEGIDVNATLLTGVIYKDPKQAGNAANSAMPSGPGMGRRF